MNTSLKIETVLRRKERTLEICAHAGGFSYRRAVSGPVESLEEFALVLEQLEDLFDRLLEELSEREDFCLSVRCASNLSDRLHADARAIREQAEALEEDLEDLCGRLAETLRAIREEYGAETKKQR